MKIEKFQPHGNNSLCVGPFQLLRSRAPAQLRRNIVHCRIHKSSPMDAKVSEVNAVHIFTP
jgi:hypothetical protein